MENIKLINKIKIDEALDRAFNDLICYVLPSVDEVDNPKQKNNYKSNFVLGGFLGDEFFIIKEELDTLGEQARFIAGMQLNILRDKDGFLNIIMDKSYPLSYRKLGATIKVGKNKVELCYGQSVLVTAPPEGGKSYMTELVVDAYIEQNPKIKTYRLLFGERKDDSLGKGTIDCNSSTTVDYQLYVLYKYLCMALKDAYRGQNVVIAIDSLTRMVEVLTNKYSHSHMLSGGISSSVKNMVGRLFRMPGQLGKGTLTMIGTCLWARTNNSWKAIYSELSSIATAEMRPDIRTGEKNRSRRSPQNNRKYFKVFGIEFEL